MNNVILDLNIAGVGPFVSVREQAYTYFNQHGNYTETLRNTINNVCLF